MSGEADAGRAPSFEAVVVGAGISGLSAAFRLARAGLRVAVLEASPRPGGALVTHDEGGFRFELGPNTVVESDPGLPALIEACGLAGERLAPSPAARRRYVWHRGRLRPLPGGPLAFLLSPLFSPGAKLRLLREPWAPPPPAAGEETIANFVRRRAGRQFLDLVVGPVVSGVYAGDPERLAVRWAAPRIAALEAEHGSLLRAALARRRGAAPRRGMVSLAGGIEELPRRLARESGEVRCGVACRRVLGRAGRFVVEHDGGSLTAARVVLAVPAAAAAALLETATAGRSRPLAEVPYAAVAVVAAGYRREDVAHPLDGFGFLRALGSGLRMLGCVFASSLFPDRAPAGHVALTAFLGGRTDPEAAGWSDERLAAAAHDDLRRVLGARALPVVSVVRRWPRAIPQYEAGHGRYLELQRELERELDGLYLAGSYLRGVSVADCVRDGLAVADRILDGAAAAPSNG